MDCLEIPIGRDNAAPISKFTHAKIIDFSLPGYYRFALKNNQ
jgi:hypothetical protein